MAISAAFSSGEIDKSWFEAMATSDEEAEKARQLSIINANISKVSSEMEANLDLMG